jgi:heat-inducible transcriptional repressor
MKGLIQRRKIVLKIIIQEYIEKAIPVASEAIIRDYDLGVSSATIRNDMAYLEQEGYIARPHTSAGCIPLDKAYRYYVESLSSNTGLPPDERHRIRISFQEVEEEIDRWLRLSAMLIAQLVGNAAIVTIPRSEECRLKHIELISLHEFLAMLILVMSEPAIRQHLITFDEPVSQERLNYIANKLNAHYSGHTLAEISPKSLDMSGEEQRVTESVIDIMSSENEVEHEELYLEGLRLMLSQPEFVEKERMLGIMALMEEKAWLPSVLSKQASGERVQVIIGGESKEDSLRDLSLVFSRYGVPQKTGGTIGVIGPTRMNYPRAISTVNYVADVLSNLLADIYR